MLKKFFTLLFALLWCTVLLAQEVPMKVYVDPRTGPFKVGGYSSSTGMVVDYWMSSVSTIEH